LKKKTFFSRKLLKITPVMLSIAYLGLCQHLDPSFFELFQVGTCP
jgi:hypothetical protein